MKKVLITFFLIGGLFPGEWMSCAHGHLDVQFSYVNNKINVQIPAGETDLVFGSFFPTTGIEQHFATLPGFASEVISGLGIGAGDQIYYDVIDDLLYWDGVSVTAPPSGYSIEITNNPSPPTVPLTTVDENSGQQLGSEVPPKNRIDNADAAGNFHRDLQWRLYPSPFPSPSPPADFGAFGIKLRLRTNALGVDVSDPFIFAFNFGLNSTGFEQAVDAFGDLLAGQEGDFDLDGDVDGEDYLLWQQGLSPDPLSAGDLSDWQTNYGTNPPPLLQSAVGIPEPQTALLCLLGMALLFGSKPRFQIMSG